MTQKDLLHANDNLKPLDESLSKQSFYQSVIDGDSYDEHTKQEARFILKYELDKFDHLLKSIDNVSRAIDDCLFYQKWHLDTIHDETRPEAERQKARFLLQQEKIFFAKICQDLNQPS